MTGKAPALTQTLSRKPKQFFCYGLSQVNGLKLCRDNGSVWSTSAEWQKVL
jgi:hypothetical protein